jgi:hypothetical protein
MSIHLADSLAGGLPPEPRLLSAVTVRLIAESERARFDEFLETEHYLKNPAAVGQVLRYAAEYEGRWVALLMFSSAALHLKPRDRWLQWAARQVPARRHLLAQNSRFLVLASAGRWPNLASRVLKLVCGRLALDWQEHFGHPVLAVETFVDPQRFKGTCYKAAGWQLLGPTQGFGRSWQDFYTDTQHPKELWVRALSPEALAQLRSPELPPALTNPAGPPPPPCPVPTAQLDSLWECFRSHMTDPRKPKGLRHQLASFLTLVALAVAAGCQGPHAIAQFAQSLNHGQRRHVRCRPRAGRPAQYDVPSERTFRRLLKEIDPEQLKTVLTEWMESADAAVLAVVHFDGKVIKNADPAPARPQAPGTPEPPAPEPSEIPLGLQKPKADQALTLVNFMTSNQRLIEQIAVPADTNEEAAVAAHLPAMDLAGVCLTADAAHTTKANCRQVTQNNGADYLFFLKGNQPLALAKAEQLLPGAFPPSEHHGGQRPRTDRNAQALEPRHRPLDPRSGRSGSTHPSGTPGPNGAARRGHQTDP